ncbi:MAG: MBL fold metallo-hydrolase [Betaproteobacteria bacterium]|nr:MBL fold metallo-hydrolase [Betaproteobacteria bacterium]
MKKSQPLRRAAATMGEPKTIRYVSEGNGWTFGQAFVPGAPWPKIAVHNQIRTINYDTGSMRQEITFSRAEPKGGGGYPLSGQVTNNEFISGGSAWNVVGNNPVAGPRFIADRVHQLWTTPHGVLKAAQRNKATVEFQTKGGKSLAAVSFTEPGRLTATAYFNEAFLLERVESRLPDPVMGEAAAVTNYSEYRDTGGVKFPMRIQQSQGGHPTLDVIVKEAQPNVPADIQVPEAVAKATDRITSDKVADGVWFIAGASHNSVAIEMKDHIVMVEAPLNDGRSGPVIDQVKKLAPGKPIRFVINSHHHFDHTGGIRTAAAAGATIVTQAASKAYFEKNLATASRINPDMLAKSGKKGKVRGVGDKLVMGDGTRSIELHRIQGSQHTDTFLIVYLPKEKLLVEADAYTPAPPDAKPPATPNPYHVNLVENIERLKLSVDRILPLHGRVVPVGDLYTAIGKKR